MLVALNLEHLQLHFVLLEQLHIFLLMKSVLLVDAIGDGEAASVKSNLQVGHLAVKLFGIHSEKISIISQT